MAYEIVSKDEFTGGSSDMEGEAAFCLASCLYEQGVTIDCIIADKDGTSV